MVLSYIPRDSRGDTTNERPEKSILDRKSPFLLQIWYQDPEI